MDISLFKETIYLTCLLMFFNGCTIKNKFIHLNAKEKIYGKLIYKNDFNDLSDWKTEQVQGGKVEIKNGMLEITDIGGLHHLE